MEIFKKEKKVEGIQHVDLISVLRRLRWMRFHCPATSKSTDRQTDRQRGREAGLNNYNNATDPECGENFFLVSCKSGNWNNCQHANQFHAFPHSALLAFQTSNRQAVCEMKHCVVVSGVFVNKGGESRDNDYDGKEENERDLYQALTIFRFSRQCRLACSLWESKSFPDSSSNSTRKKTKLLPHSKYIFSVLFYFHPQQPYYISLGKEKEKKVKEEEREGEEEGQRDKYNQQAYFEKILKLFSEKTDIRPKTNIAL
ncbi:hypothetical protein T06_2460 [Trichinella sp. T6]|nr:hypothetical protein T06_2460 [Trichinella sp. T6]